MENWFMEGIKMVFINGQLLESRYKHIPDLNSGCQEVPGLRRRRLKLRQNFHTPHKPPLRDESFGASHDRG